MKNNFKNSINVGRGKGMECGLGGWERITVFTRSENKVNKYY